MSTVPESSGAPRRPSHYAERADRGDETWLEDAIEAYLGIEVTEAQRRICRSVASNRRTLVITANGLGKSYILAAIAVIWLVVRYPAVSFATSGTEKKMRRTFCKPVENLHDNAVVPLPGTYKSRPERIEIDGEPEHFFEAASPKDADELEGVHTAYTLAIIEEADKPAVDEEVLDSMRSLVTDEQDRMVAIANPPKDEANSIVPLMESSKWDVIEFSSFQSHNVQVELGEVDGEKIDGLATLTKIQDDWEEYNDEAWPGVDAARKSHERDDLDERWYRRRLGVMPPDTASAHRPFTVSNVEAAWERDVDAPREPAGVGIDVARTGGDQTVLAGVHGDQLRIHHAERGANHRDQEEALRGVLDGWPEVEAAVDAVGEGSGLADALQEAYPNVARFNAGATPADETEFYDNWTAGLHALGEWLEAGGSIQDPRLREELLVAARVVEFDEKFYASRGRDGAEVLKASSKSDVKDRLDRSPDYLDAAYMAVLAADGQTSRRQPRRLTW